MSFLQYCCCCKVNSCHKGLREIIAPHAYYDPTGVQNAAIPRIHTILYTEKMSARDADCPSSSSDVHRRKSSTKRLQTALYAADLRFSTFDIDALLSVFAIVDELAQYEEVEEDGPCCAY